MYFTHPRLLAQQGQLRGIQFVHVIPPWYEMPVPIKCLVIDQCPRRS